MNNTNNQESFKASGQPVANVNDHTPTTPTASSKPGKPHVSPRRKSPAVYDVIVHRKMHYCAKVRVIAHCVTEAEAKAQTVAAKRGRWELVGVDEYGVNIRCNLVGGQGNE